MALKLIDATDAKTLQEAGWIDRHGVVTPDAQLVQEIYAHLIHTLQVRELQAPGQPQLTVSVDGNQSIVYGQVPGGVASSSAQAVLARVVAEGELAHVLAWLDLPQALIPEVTTITVHRDQLIDEKEDTRTRFWAVKTSIQEEVLTLVYYRGYLWTFDEGTSPSYRGIGVACAGCAGFCYGYPEMWVSLRLY